jgi:hypothetical protein
MHPEPRFSRAAPASPHAGVIPPGEGLNSHGCMNWGTARKISTDSALSPAEGLERNRPIIIIRCGGPFARNERQSQRSRGSTHSSSACAAAVSKTALV